MKVIHLEQGTEDWLKWRKGESFVDAKGQTHAGCADGGKRITATAASVCGGYNPFNTIHGLFDEMTGRVEAQKSTYPMERGSRLEPFARAAYEKVSGEVYEAVCIQSSEHDWIAASLDGLDAMRTRGAEFKCPMSKKPDGSHAMALDGVVAPYYYDQIQWQFASSDNRILEIDYFSYFPEMGEAKPITVLPDLARQTALRNAVMEFRLSLMQNIPVAGEEWEEAVKKWLLANHLEKAAKERADACKDRLKELAGNTSISACGASVSISTPEPKPDLEKVIDSLVAKYQIDPSILEQTMAECMGAAKKPVVSVRATGDANLILQRLLSEQNINS